MVATGGAWSCETTTLPDGAYTFAAVQTDAAGNASPRSATVKTAVDTTAPAVPALTGPADGLVIPDGSPNPPITGARSAAGETIEVLSAGVVICRTEVASNGSWSCTPATTFLAGSHRLSIVQVDPAGNVSATAYLTLTKRAPEVVTATASPVVSTVSAAPVTVITSVTVVSSDIVASVTANVPVTDGASVSTVMPTAIQSTVENRTLASTGDSFSSWSSLGGVLLLAGVITLVFARRRPAGPTGEAGRS